MVASTKSLTVRIDIKTSCPRSQNRHLGHSSLVEQEAVKDLAPANLKVASVTVWFSQPPAIQSMDKEALRDGNGRRGLAFTGLACGDRAGSRGKHRRDITSHLAYSWCVRVETHRET